MRLSALQIAGWEGMKGQHALLGTLLLAQQSIFGRVMMTGGHAHWEGNQGQALDAP